MVTTSIFQLVSFVFIGTKFFFMKYVATIITDQYDIIAKKPNHLSIAQASFSFKCSDACMSHPPL